MLLFVIYFLAYTICSRVGGNTMSAVNTADRINFRVRFSELSLDRHVSISKIAGYIEDCNIFELEDTSTGIHFLFSHNLSWFVSGWQIYVKRYPAFNERLKIRTWDHKTESLISYRNAEIIDANGERIVLANCPCVLMDTKKGRPIKIPKDIIKPLASGHSLDMDYEPRKISIPKNFTEEEPFSVRKADLDLNCHVTSPKYIAYAEEYISDDYFIRQVRVDYRKAAILHDKIYPRISGLKDNRCTIQLCDENGGLFAAIEFLLE